MKVKRKVVAAVELLEALNDEEAKRERMGFFNFLKERVIEEA